jgi:hypothetical protein
VPDSAVLRRMRRPASIPGRFRIPVVGGHLGCPYGDDRIWCGPVTTSPWLLQASSTHVLPPPLATAFIFQRLPERSIELATEESPSDYRGG